MTYNTFTNEIGTNEIGTNEIGANEIGANEIGTNEIGTNEIGTNEIDTDTDKQCIICLEKTPINDKDHITLMNDMHFLVKKCTCLCYAHHKCLEKWIDTNAVCPICKGEISFPGMVMKNKDFIIDMQSNGIQSNSIQSNSIQSNSIQSNSIQSNADTTNPGSSHFCIRMIILLFFTLTVLQIVCRN